MSHSAYLIHSSLARLASEQASWRADRQTDRQAKSPSYSRPRIPEVASVPMGKGKGKGREREGEGELVGWLGGREVR